MIILQSRRPRANKWSTRNRFPGENASYMTGDLSRSKMLRHVTDLMQRWQQAEPMTQFRLVESGKVIHV